VGSHPLPSLGRCRQDLQRSIRIHFVFVHDGDHHQLLDVHRLPESVVAIATSDVETVEGHEVDRLLLRLQDRPQS